MRRCCLALVLVCAAGSTAAASTYAVNPTRVVFGPRSSSQLLTIKNESNGVLRFQLSMFAWNQTASGEMQLTPSSDVVAFPTLLVLKPREERRVRIGLTTAAASLEKSYRIFVEELPPVPGDGSGDAGTVRVLTRMGIPVFLQPAKPKAVATLTNLTAARGRLSFDVRNDGNVHFVIGAATVRGLSASGDMLFETALEGWYVLAAGLRTFETAIPAESCAALASLRVEVRIGDATLREPLAVSSAACGA